jgi:sugar lactone lactonase YvrE
LSNRRVWADLGNGIPDGICLDADGAVWKADVPNKALRPRSRGRRSTAGATLLTRSLHQRE